MANKRANQLATGIIMLFVGLSGFWKEGVPIETLTVYSPYQGTPFFGDPQFKLNDEIVPGIVLGMLQAFTY